MSNVPLKDADNAIFRPATFARDDAGQTVHAQAVVGVDPATGLPNAATEATLSALKDAALAIKAAAEALNGKAVAIDTGDVSIANFPATQAVSGTVSVANLPATQAVIGAVQITNDAGSPIPVDTGLQQALTNTQLRAAAVPVSLASAPLPTGASSEATLSALSATAGAPADTSATSDTGSFSLVALVKRLLGKTPNLGQAAAANSQPVVIASDQSPVPITGSISASTDFWASIKNALERISNPIWVDPASGRLRVLIDALGGAQTLGTVSTVTTVTTVTTCATVTNLSQAGGVPMNSVVYDQMHAAWALAVRPRIS